MGIRLYDSVWVELEGRAEPLQVRRDLKNLAAFNAGEFQYDIDGRPLSLTINVPKIVRLHNLQSAREAGLPMRYDPVNFAVESPTASCSKTKCNAYASSLA